MLVLHVTIHCYWESIMLLRCYVSITCNNTLLLGNMLVFRNIISLLRCYVRHVTIHCYWEILYRY